MEAIFSSVAWNDTPQADAPQRPTTTSRTSTIICVSLAVIGVLSSMSLLLFILWRRRRNTCQSRIASNQFAWTTLTSLNPSPIKTEFTDMASHSPTNSNPDPQTVAGDRALSKIPSRPHASRPPSSWSTDSTLVLDLPRNKLRSTQSLPSRRSSAVPPSDGIPYVPEHLLKLGSIWDGDDSRLFYFGEFSHLFSWEPRDGDSCAASSIHS